MIVQIIIGIFLAFALWLGYGAYIRLKLIRQIRNEANRKKRHDEVSYLVYDKKLKMYVPVQKE